MQEEYWKILNKTTDWIKFSDTKAVVILTIYGIIITIAYSNGNEILNHFNESNFAIVLSVIAIISSCLSIFYSFLAINPRLKNPNPTSLIYFGHIQKKFDDFTQYYEHSKTVLNDETEYEKQVAEQVFENSKIAWKKFQNITYSIRFFFFSIIILIASIIEYLF